MCRSSRWAASARCSPRRCPPWPPGTGSARWRSPWPGCCTARPTSCSSPAPRRWHTCGRTSPARASPCPGRTSPGWTRSAADTAYAFPARPLGGVPSCLRATDRPGGVRAGPVDQVPGPMPVPGAGSNHGDMSAATVHPTTPPVRPTGARAVSVTPCAPSGSSSAPPSRSSSSASTARRRASAAARPPSALRQQFVRVHDPVRVALLRQEPLAVCREVLVDGVPGDHGVEVRLVTVRLGPQHPAEPLRLLLAGAEGARRLDGDRRLRQVDREVGDLRHHQHADLALAERREQLLPLQVGRLALDDGGAQVLAQFVELVDVLAD